MALRESYYGNQVPASIPANKDFSDPIALCLFIHISTVYCCHYLDSFNKGQCQKRLSSDQVIERSCADKMKQLRFDSFSTQYFCTIEVLCKNNNKGSMVLPMIFIIFLKMMSFSYSGYNNCALIIDASNLSYPMSNTSFSIKDRV